MKKNKNNPEYFYFLSKQKNFRSRAAFKLIELNKKFKFFQKKGGVLDLCASPGSWLQVSRKLLSKENIIIGIDACFIKPIVGCIIFKGDITSKGCFFTISEIKNSLKKEINVILHDGAPKMGIAWVRDVYNQNILALKAFKLGIQCLKKNGWFVSKIFFSENVHGLLFALQYFFFEIKICKPRASRQTSAETYIICKNFILPIKFDNILLNPEYIFKDSFSNKHSFFNKSPILVKEKKFSSFLKFIRFNFKKSYRKDFINLNDEYFSSCGFSYFGNFFQNKINKKKKIFQTFFFLIINWQSFILEKKSFL
jgi:AdoMet-dependent rRNA methyltransferase SPB1